MIRLYDRVATRSPVVAAGTTTRVCVEWNLGEDSRAPPFAPSMRLRKGNGVVRPRNPLGPCLAGRKWNADKLADTYVTPIVEAGSGSIPREEVAS
jgi:hypothetical protein